MRSSSIPRYNVDDNMDRHNRNLAQLTVEMERQLLIISPMTDRLRSRWGLPWGLPVIRQRRHRRYRFRPAAEQVHANAAVHADAVNAVAAAVNAVAAACVTCVKVYCIC